MEHNFFELYSQSQTEATLSVRDVALLTARYGYKVFPVSKNKRPAVKDDFAGRASTNETDIKRMFENAPSAAGVGISTEGLCVIDFDRAEEDTDISFSEKAFNFFEKFGINIIDELNDLATFYTISPSRGLHFYFRDDENRTTTSASKLAPKVDSRGNRGYIIAPGSRTEKGEYVVGKAYSPRQTVGILNRSYLMTIPDSIVEAINHRDIVASDYTYTNTSDLSAYERAQRYVDSIPVISDDRKNTAFRVACKLKAFGLSEPDILAAMSDWSNSCGQDASDLKKAVSNAIKYGTDSIIPRRMPTTDVKKEDNYMSISPAKNEISVEQPKTTTGVVKAAMASNKPFNGFNSIKHSSLIQKRPWLVDGLLIRGDVTTVAAQGAAGKTTLMLTIACLLAAGERSILGFDNAEKHKDVKSIIFSAEDSVDELSRRIAGIVTLYGLDFDTVSQHVAINSGKDMNMLFAKKRSSDIIENSDLIDSVVEFCAEENVGFIAFDPLSNLHACDENNSADMTAVIQIFARIAARVNASVMLMHHTTKSNESGVMSTRGSGAIINSSRIAMTLAGFDEARAQEFGISVQEARSLSTMSVGKSNITSKDGMPTTFKMSSVSIGNGDEVGVPVLVDFKEMKKRADELAASEIISCDTSKVSEVYKVMKAKFPSRFGRMTIAEFSHELEAISNKTGMFYIAGSEIKK